MEINETKVIKYFPSDFEIENTKKKMALQSIDWKTTQQSNLKMKRREK